jgi:hypothetical protein
MHRMQIVAGVIELLQLLVKYQIVKLSDRYLSNAPLFEGAEVL